MINVGIIGCGKIGSKHLSFLSNINEIKVNAVCDIIRERAEKASKNVKTNAYSDYADMIKKENLDLVHICVPNGLHAKIAMDCLNAGKNVLVEKPMAMNIDECRKMIEAADKNKKRLFVVKQNRFNKPITLLKEALNNKKLGKIYMIECNVLWNRRPEYYQEAEWRGTKEMDGGALLTQVSHFVDMMQWFGGEVESVYAKMDNHNHPEIEIEDTGAMIIRFKNGIIGNLNYTTCIHDKNIEGSITVLGTKGTVKVGGEYLNKIEIWNVENYPLLSDSEEKAPANDYGSYKGSASKHDEVFKKVTNILNGKKEECVDGEEGMKTVEIIQAAFMSAETGKEIKLPLG